MSGTGDYKHKGPVVESRYVKLNDRRTKSQEETESQLIVRLS